MDQGSIELGGDEMSSFIFELTCSTGWPGGGGELVVRQAGEVVGVHVVVRLQTVVTPPSRAVVCQRSSVL